MENPSIFNMGGNKIGVQSSKRQSVISYINHGKNVNAKLVSVLVVGSLATSALGATVSYYGNSFQNCLDFAASFQNTCTIPSPDTVAYDLMYRTITYADVDEEEVYCDELTEECPIEEDNPDSVYKLVDQSAGGTDDGPCYWMRKLCVMCQKLPNTFFQDNDVDYYAQAYIRVISNNMPDHCFVDSVNPPLPQEVDFQVVFNPQYTQNLRLNNAITQEQQNAYLCNPTSQTNQFEYYKGESLIEQHMFKTNPTNRVTSSNEEIYPMQETNGISLNGILFKPAANSSGLDQIFPRSYEDLTTKSKGVDLDQCLGTTKATMPATDSIDGTEDTDEDGVYHYLTMSPCILGNLDVKQLSFSCDTDPVCKKSPTVYFSQNITNTSRTVSPVGLAKDGRIMYGPYRIDGEVWDTCDVDICNGRPMGGGIYGYVMTEFFPYTLGCWGPGRNIKNRLFFPSCSVFPRQCPNTQTFSNFASHLAAFSMASLAALMVALA